MNNNPAYINDNLHIRIFINMRKNLCIEQFNRSKDMNTVEIYSKIKTYLSCLNIVDHNESKQKIATIMFDYIISNDTVKGFIYSYSDFEKILKEKCVEFHTFQNFNYDIKKFWNDLFLDCSLEEECKKYFNYEDYLNLDNYENINQTQQKFSIENIIEPQSEFLHLDNIQENQYYNKNEPEFLDLEEYDEFLNLDNKNHSDYYEEFDNYFN